MTATESGKPFPMPDDFDGNALLPAGGGRWWLLSAHELRQPRVGDWQAEWSKCRVEEQRSDGIDSNGWGAVSRLLLDASGTRVLQADLIATGMHNLCAAAVTPWRTLLVNEETPFLDDPRLHSGWVWEIDPATGRQTRARGMGRFSHEQEALAADGAWYLTDDRGGPEFLYKFVPDAARSLSAGKLYGLVFDRRSGKGRWVGPLDPVTPEREMATRGYDPARSGFVRAEGIVASPNRRSVVFAESGSGGRDPGRIWQLSNLGPATLRGRVLVRGSFAALSRPDNLRFSPAGDLFVLEDHGKQIGLANRRANEIRILQPGKHVTVPFATFRHAEPTGPWFGPGGRVLYVSIQPTGPSRLLAVTGRSFSKRFVR